MGLFYSHIEHNFIGFYKGGHPVFVFYEIDIKRNFTYLFKVKTTELIFCINNCIRNILENIVKSSMYEGHDIHRLIDDDKLEALNNTLNGVVHTWVPKGIKIKNLKITHLI